MEKSNNSIDVVETTIEKISIVLIVIGIFLLIIGEYILSAFVLMAVLYSCYNFFRNGLIMISFGKDIIQYKCMKNFRIKRGEFLPSELNENSLIIIKKITGLTSYEELVFVKDNVLLFRDSALSIYNLGDEKRDCLIKKINQIISNN